MTPDFTSKFLARLACISMFALAPFAAANEPPEPTGPIPGISYIRKSKHGLQSDEISDIVFDTKKVWIATHEGLFLMDIAEKRWTRFGRKDGLLTPKLQCLADDGDTLWIGGVGGLAKLDKKTLKITPVFLPLGTNTLRPKDMRDVRDQLDQVILTITVEDDRLWIGTDFGGGIYDKKTGKVERLRYWGDWAYDDYYAITPTRDHVYVSAAKAFAVLNRKTGDWRVYATCVDQYNDMIGGYAMDVGPGMIWIASRAGLFLFNRESEQMGMFTIAPADPYFRKDSKVNWFALIKLMDTSKTTVSSQLAGLVEDEEDQDLVYGWMENEARRLKFKPDDPPAEVSPAFLKIFNDILEIPTAFTEPPVVEAHRDLNTREKAELKRTKKRPKHILDPSMTARLNLIGRKDATPFDIAIFNRQVMNMFMSDILGPYRKPGTQTSLPKRQYFKPASVPRLYLAQPRADGMGMTRPFGEDGIPRFGEIMPASTCWDVLVVDSEVWGATNEGLVVLNLETDRYRYYSEAQGLMNRRVFGLYFDGRRIWATTKGGVNVIPVK